MSTLLDQHIQEQSMHSGTEDFANFDASREELTNQLEESLQRHDLDNQLIEEDIENDEDAMETDQLQNSEQNLMKNEDNQNDDNMHQEFHTGKIENPEEEQKQGSSTLTDVSTGDDSQGNDPKTKTDSNLREDSKTSNGGGQYNKNMDYNKFCSTKIKELLLANPNLSENREQLATLVATEWTKFQNSIQKAAHQATIQIVQGKPTIKHVVKLFDDKKSDKTQDSSFKNLKGSTSIVQGKSTLNLSGKNLKDGKKRKRRTKEELGISKNDDERVKKTLNPYMFFVKENRSRVGLENPGKSMKECMNILSDKWKALNEEEKAKYVQMTADDKIRHDQEVKHLKDNPKPKPKIDSSFKKLSQEEKAQKEAASVQIAQQPQPKQQQQIPLQFQQQTFDSKGQHKRFQQPSISTEYLYSMIQQQNQVITLLTQLQQQNKEQLSQLNSVVQQITNTMNFQPVNQNLGTFQPVNQMLLPNVQQQPIQMQPAPLSIDQMMDSNMMALLQTTGGINGGSAQGGFGQQSNTTQQPFNPVNGFSPNNSQAQQLMMQMMQLAQNQSM